MNSRFDESYTNSFCVSVRIIMSTQSKYGLCSLQIETMSNSEEQNSASQVVQKFIVIPVLIYIYYFIVLLDLIVETQCTAWWKCSKEDITEGAIIVHSMVDNLVDILLDAIVYSMAVYLTTMYSIVSTIVAMAGLVSESVLVLEVVSIVGLCAMYEYENKNLRRRSLLVSTLYNYIITCLICVLFFAV